MGKMFKFSGIIETEEWKPTDIAGCLIWLRSDLAWQDAAKTIPCAADGDLIYVGKDKALNNDAIQATSGSRPKFYTNQINGYPAWRFDGIDDFLQTLPFDSELSQPFTIFLVLQASAPLDSGYIMEGLDGDHRAGFDQKFDGTYNGIYAGDGWLTDDIPDTNPHYFDLIYNGASSKIFKDGIDVSGAPSNPGTNAIRGLTFGALWNGTQPWKGMFAEKVLYSALSDPNRLLIEKYFKGRYAIS